MTHRLFVIPALAASLLLGACASDGGSGGLFSTASVTPPPAEQPKPVARKVDPQCVTLASQIDALRKDGAIERLEKVAAGKGNTVPVQRAAIAKQAELNKANAEFQVKCAPRVPLEASAPVATPAVAAAVAPAAAPAAKAAAKAAVPSGVTVAAPAQAKPQ